MSSRIPYGSRMIRVSDGMSGVLEEHQGELRIFYQDRGERLIAPKSEKWEPWERSQGPLHETEKLQVALTADRVLRGIMHHSPSRLWEPLDLEAIPFDPELVKVIVEYLGTRS